MAAAFLPFQPFASQSAVSEIFELMGHSHLDTLRMLDSLHALAVRLTTDKPDQTQREEAEKLLAFFSHDVREHQIDEETHIYPRVLYGADKRLAQQAQELLAEHDWLEESWMALEPLLSAAARGTGRIGSRELFYAVEVFIDIYKDHIALEERFIYPVARAAIPAPLAGQIGRSIMQRRLARQKRGATAVSGPRLVA
ncbi:MAG: hemerythrin domain-containing protein [Brachymonas sp.]|nr:hemerythrin domain-containing protein [Brachymonas sp.]